jgi:hypothetical protein
MKLLFAFLALLIGCSAGEVAGKWNIVVPARDGNQIKYQLVLRGDGGTYSGFISSEEGDATLSDIKVSDTGLTFKVETDNATYAVKATLDGDSMKGKYTVNGSAGGTFTATRSKD